MSSPVSTRLFIEGLDITPDNQVLVFTNATAVGNYYGASSYEYTMAQTYFTGPYRSSATMEFVRDSNSQRPHLIGANLGNSLPNVNGPISLTFDGFTYSGSVNTAGAANLTDVALDVQNALNSNLHTAAVTTGDSIKPETVQFTGTLNMSQLYVTSVQSGGRVVVGGVISGPGIINTNYDAQIIFDHGTTKQGEHYSTFSNSGTASGALTETYGILQIGDRVSGQIKAGDHLSGPGVMANTAIVLDLGGGSWLVNNAQAISGDFTVTAPVLTVQSNQLQGPTASHNFLEVSVGGEYGFDQRPSKLSFAEEGSAADLLGLSQSSGAMDSSPGGERVSIAQMMAQFIKLASPDPFGSFQSAEPRLDGAFEYWAQHHPYTFLPNNHKTTTPAGDTTTFTWTGGTGNWDTPGDWNPPGPPTASSPASIGGTTTETIVVESPNAVSSLILDDPNAVVGIGAVAGAQLTVAHTLAIENGSFGIGALGTLDATHIHIAAPKGSTEPTTGTLFFPGSATINATIENEGTIEAEGVGVVDFEKTMTGTGTSDISGGATLEFMKAVSDNVNFGAGGGTLELLQPGKQSGDIAGFSSGDTISLHGSWAFDTLTNPTSGTTDLTLRSGKGATHTFDFTGTYTQNEFTIASGHTTTVTFA